jgi:dTDP-4-dehydrorhamnose 3,5-epimerase
MKFIPTPLPGSYLINLELKEDDRGFFARYYCEREYLNLELNTCWVQINNSLSKDVGTLRGLHFQRPPHAEVKVVRCLQGAIWDVIVDLREGSNTYGKWFGAELSASNRIMMYVPRGFAHGFITLEPNSEILYLVSDYYKPSLEGILLWSDPDIGIAWPIEPTTLSGKDSEGKRLLNLDPIFTDI